MIVYRAQHQTTDTSWYLHEIDTLLQRFERSGYTEHQHAVELLIDYGEFEAAVADALSTDANLADPTVSAIRQTSLLAGRLFCHSWEGAADKARFWSIQFRRALEGLAGRPLPQALNVRVPQGYAYYSLYPEAYLEAARRFSTEVRPRRVTCIGIRSVGTSLSSVVSAALAQRRCVVQSYTVRCHGHPLDRRLSLDPVLEERFRMAGDRYFLIVDEGPGLSGSSMCSVAQKLADLGVPDERIFFFPSRDVDAAQLLSPAARDRWPRHRKYMVSFEDLWLESGRLARSLPQGELVDISGGKWRCLFFRDESRYPAVHPGHERRKYLCLERPLAPAGLGVLPPLYLEGPGGKTPPLMLKFAGLGRYGRLAYDRAKLLSEAGFHPPVLGLTNGFLFMEFVHGRPMGVEKIDAVFLDRVVRYLAHLSRTPALGAPMSHEELMHMIEVNITEGLGASWAGKLAHARFNGPNDHAGSTDGRMMLHEWLHTDDSYLKTDSVDHQNDHFSPGCRDIAWDIAACVTEWGLDRPMQNYLIGQYRSLVHDDSLTQRLPFYSIAYLAHRLGYATTAMQMLGLHCADGRRFKTLAAFYTTLLQQELSHL